ncbi:MAG: signal peptidase II [Rothia sp. (in: high G+C Gram-positive bacteria)]|nr:signal peptidase II [Rothia sp. (in: high G+C Gram-positive bacteria)]
MDTSQEIEPRKRERPLRRADRKPATLSGRSKLLLALGLTLLAWGSDQALKALVETRMTLGERIPVIDGLLWWHYILNPGAAFSMGEEFTWVFTLIMVAAVLVCLYYLVQAQASSWIFSLSLLLGGVLGNLTDRLFRPPGFGVGQVVDYISVGKFAIFNIADACICTAMGLLVLLVFRGIKLNGEREETASARGDR